MATAAGQLRSRLAPGAWRSRWQDPAVRRRWYLRFWFYVGVPVLLGFLFGWLRVGRTGAWPTEASLVYWIGLSVVTTWLTDLGTRPVAMVLRPLGSPLWLSLFAGQLVAGAVLVLPFAKAYSAWANGLVPPALALAPVTATLVEVLQRLPSNTLLWVGLNLLFFHAFRMPRMGYVPAAGVRDVGPPVMGDAPGADTAASADGTGAVAAPAPVLRAADAASPASSPASSTFMERVRPERRGPLVALRAEGHYLRVYTDAGSELILYRLSDAMKDVGAEPGARVHRSWWVAARALADERHPEHVRLTNGLNVPVSRSYRLAARERGWLR